jgi:excisionase family DNA binding protein
VETPVEDELLTPGEVARLFGVNPKTITRWAMAGKLRPIRTLGGHRRYRASEVRSLLEDSNAGESGDPVL